jgi:very-short-patch-repair endonuclease/predicted transcriptional regulator of viral defense system
MKEVQHVPSLSRTLRAEPPRDVAIGRLAERQHGVVSLSQLRSLGLTASGVRSRVARGRLTGIHRGVYAVGCARLTMRGHWMAAVLAYGPKAVLSHRSAAGLWGILGDSRATTDISLPRPSARPRAGIEVHRSTTLTAHDVTTHDAIPCTTLARTLLDLADAIDRRGVERAVDQAEVLRLFDLRAVEDVLSRGNGRRGAGVLRAVLADYDGPTLTDSEFEERFLAVCRRARLPTPEVNQWIALEDGEVKADFLWRAEHLVIETDGYGPHGTRRAFEADRRRDRRLRLAGYETFRFTWRELIEEPAEIAETLRRLLALRTRLMAA